MDDCNGWAFERRGTTYGEEIIYEPTTGTLATITESAGRLHTH